ncbi:hypothetical protein [Wolbachia endosymbiont of Litomosoides brasiliensis]|uniref:hypothetical protein n=1 Tax=Wolbachia endosymbiont of Litomosoides brasiliensis TaxID=1812117 RepID=UPI00158E7A89|nr:hypothetical protein [Wolbachia endosymbiont of Litomosoides brasiliensis]
MLQKKLSAVIVVNILRIIHNKIKAQYSSRSKNMLHLKSSTDHIDKAPKIWKRKKLFVSP